MEHAHGANLTRGADHKRQLRCPVRLASQSQTAAGGRDSAKAGGRIYPYSTRGRIVTMPGQSVSSSTKPTMMSRYGIVTRAM
ncbi:hypothetical protein ACVIN2_005644 [Bradyrhizobium sp. USDA 3650]